MSPRHRHVPVRTCVACRTAQDKRALVRVVRSPDGVVSADATGKQRGRGAYVCPSETCIDRARRRGILAKHLGVEVPSEVFEDLLRLVAARSAQ